MKNPKSHSAEYRRRKNVYYKVQWATLLVNAFGAVISVFYFAFASGLTPTNVNQAAGAAANFFSLTFFVVAFLLGVGFAWGSRMDKPLWNWYFTSAEDPSDRESSVGPASPRVRHMILNHPFDNAWISLVMWNLAGLVFGFSMWTSGQNWIRALSIFLGIGPFTGTITGTILYFLTERILRPELPIFFPNGKLSETSAFRVTVRRRMMILFVVAAIPLLILATNAYIFSINVLEADRPERIISVFWILTVYLVSIGFLLAGALGLTLGVSLVSPVETLRERMRRVQRGEIEAQLPVTSNDELGELMEGFNAMLEGLQQEEVIRRLFSLYVTSEVAEHAIHHGATLGGTLTEATVLFSDIRGFTSLAEEMDPEQLIALLNRYFDRMSQAIVKHGGLVNKFGGDSLLAIFGTPINPVERHPGRAVRAAQEMLRTLEGFNVEQRENGEPELCIGIGIATGSVVAGNVGGKERLEYTVIGDAVNLASRLETLTKELSVSVLFSEPTAQATASWANVKPVGEFTVRGKEKPVRVYTLELNEDVR